MHLNKKRLCDCVYSGKGALYTQMIAKKKNRTEVQRMSSLSLVTLTSPPWLTYF